MPELMELLLQQYSLQRLGENDSHWHRLLAAVREKYGAGHEEAIKAALLDFAAKSRQLMLDNALQETSYSSGQQVLNFGMLQAAWPTNDPLDQPQPVVPIGLKQLGVLTQAGALAVTSMHDGRATGEVVTEILPI